MLALERILKSYEAWFDVQRDYAYEGRIFPGYAEYHAHGEQYVLLKRAKLWEVDTHEYVFFAQANLFDEKEAQDLATFMTTKALLKVDSAPPHMSSALTMVVLADRVSVRAGHFVRKFRFRKNYLLGFRGWADVRLAVVDFSQESIIANSAGKELVTALEAAAFPR